MGGIGSIINSVTGASSSAKKQQKYNLQLASVNQKYALEAMKQQYEYEKLAAQNAHQWEMQDYAKAGLNPILSAGGGASADTGLTSGSASGAGIAQGAMTPVDIINTITSAGKAFKEMNLLNAQTENTEMDTMTKELNNKWIDPKAKQDIKESLSRIGVNSAQKALTNQQQISERGKATNIAGTIRNKTNADKYGENFGKNLITKTKGGKWKHAKQLYEFSKIFW